MCLVEVSEMLLLHCLKVASGKLAALSVTSLAGIYGSWIFHTPRCRLVWSSLYLCLLPAGGEESQASGVLCDASRTWHEHQDRHTPGEEGQGGRHGVPPGGFCTILQLSVCIILSQMPFSRSQVVGCAVVENALCAVQINHPLDCPICDQGGECDLQDQVSFAS